MVLCICARAGRHIYCEPAAIIFAKVKSIPESALNNPPKLMRQGSGTETVLWKLQGAGILTRDSCKF